MDTSTPTPLRRLALGLVLGAVAAVSLAAAPAAAAPVVPGALPAYGQSGDDVRRLQEALIARGFTLKGGVDGVFSDRTRATLKAFQRVVGFKSTGVVDERTAKMLGLLAPVALDPAALPAVGATGDAVWSLQQALINAGTTVKGGADGVFGLATTIAIGTFQQARGLATTQAVDLPTAIALGLLPDLATLGIPQIAVFPMQGRCSFSDTWQEARGTRKHEGVDIVGPRGLAIYAVVDGTITKQYANASLSGNALRLTAPDGTYYFYAHLESFAPGIAPGVAVRAGQVIGYNGATGNTQTPHLHFEVHPGGGAAVNPYPVVKAVDACHVTELRPQG